MSAPPEDRSAPSDDAERLYARALAEEASGVGPDLEALCRAHPQHAESLRDLDARWRLMKTEFAGQAAEDSLERRLERLYGTGASPDVSLQGTAEPASDFSSAVLARLSGHRPQKSRYLLEGEVARGGMGAILRVWDEDLRRHLAMKVVLSEGEGTGREGSSIVPRKTLARFLEEAQVTGQLDHPGIVPVHELGLDPQGRVFFTMKLVKGRTLKEVFAQLARGEGGWTQARVLGLIQKICEAMAYAHDKGVIHRDLKPANVMVGRFGEVYVMDWGLARVLGREDDKDIRIEPEEAPTQSRVRSDRRERAGESPDSPLYTLDGDVVGTPAYMPPEQATGHIAEMGPHSDVYAVGAMLYQLLTGQMPYVAPGERVSNYAVLRWVKDGPPAALHELAPRAPAELAAICEKAMARDARRRYPDMSALAEDLAAYTEGRVVRAYETGAWAEARKWVRRNRPLAAALLAVLVLALVGLGGIGYVQARGRSVAEGQRAIALAERGRADANAAEARAETAKVLRLSDVKRLRELEQQARSLWPARAGLAPAMRDWIARASALVDNLTLHRQALADLRARALPQDAGSVQPDPEAGRDARRLAERRSILEALGAQIEGELSGEPLARAEQRALELEAEIAELEEALSSKDVWRFATSEERWQHDVLSELVAGLEDLASGLLAADAVTPNHGWSVPRRLAFAERLERGFASGGEFARAWEALLPALRAAYPGLELSAQIGLVPIGADSESGLWEFWHVASGLAPRRDPESGRLVLGEEGGLVFVLLPGGTFRMGAARPGGAAIAGQPNVDVYATPNEAPVHEVTLEPFFLSKFELTQGQWLRLAGEDPSEYGAGQEHGGVLHTLAHPVESVSWSMCQDLLAHFQLVLPTEAQWEYAARAGTGSPWWTGWDFDSLREAVNLVDQSAMRAGMQWQHIQVFPGLDDGFVFHAPVDILRPNPFGLHHVHGNVWEWCRDLYGEYGGPLRPGDGEQLLASTVQRVVRGGSFRFDPTTARASQRFDINPGSRDNGIGLRPARPLLP